MNKLDNGREASSCDSIVNFLATEEDHPFPAHAFPEVLLDYARAMAATYNAPVEVFLLMIIAAVSAAAGKGWRLTGAVPGHSNYANLFILLALQTGGGKSLAAKIFKPIFETEAERYRLWALAPTPDKRRSPALTLGSVTTAALAAELARMDDETAAIYSPEAGDLIRVVLGLYRDQGMDADLILSGYTGERYAKSRIATGTVTLAEPLISMLGLVQPLLLKEAFASVEAAERGLIGRLLCVDIDYPLPEDHGECRVVCENITRRWTSCLLDLLIQRFSRRGTPAEVVCSREAREVLRLAHNQTIERLNGPDADLRAVLIRFRENCCRVALCLHLASDANAPELSATTAKNAVRIVSWIMRQTVDQMASARTDILKLRLGALMALVPKSGFVTVRELKRCRARFAETEVRQLCCLSCGALVLAEHHPPGGGPVSLRVMWTAQEKSP